VKNNKKLFGLIGIFVLVLFIPVVVIVSQQVQNLRQHASTFPSTIQNILQRSSTTTIISRDRTDASNRFSNSPPGSGCFNQTVCPTCAWGNPCPEIACRLQFICPSGNPSPLPGPSCFPRPPCLDAIPRCLIAEPAVGWCPPTTPSPSSPPANPTPTSNPTGSTAFAFNLLLDGIGGAGDNANPTAGGNPNPLHTQRHITLEVIDKNNQIVLTKEGHISFKSTTGNFKGIIKVTDLLPGTYSLKVKVDGFLKKLIPGLQVVTGTPTILPTATPTPIPTNTPPPDDSTDTDIQAAIADNMTELIKLPSIRVTNGDITNDNKIDLLDYNILVNCYGSKADTDSCTNKQGADINDDGTIDGIDYNIFVRELSVQNGD